MNNMFFNTWVRVAALCCCLSITTQAGDWTQFRGAATDSVAAGQVLPVELSQDTIDWQVGLPGRGLSGPVISQGRVIVTASSGYHDNRLHVMSLDVATGDVVWERQFLATGRTVAHKKMCVATPTPACDIERIYAFYSSNDLICTDHDGNLQWYRGLGAEFPNASNSLGMSSSPVVTGTTVVAQVESDAEAFAIGVDTVSGETKWKIERPRKANWSSPCVLPADGDRPALVLLQGSKGMTAVHADTGEELWTYDEGASTVPSATISDGKIIVVSNGLTVLSPSADGRSFESLLNARNLRPSTPSPLVLNGTMYAVNGSGVLSAGSLETGKRLWQVRLGGKYSSSPIAAGHHLYCFSESGMASVVDVSGKKGKVVSQLDLDDTVLCSPGAAGNALYVRSDQTLWKFATP